MYMRSGLHLEKWTRGGKGTVRESARCREVWGHSPPTQEIFEF